MDYKHEALIPAT